MYLYFVFIVTYVVELICAHIFYSSASERKYKTSKCLLIGGGLFFVGFLANVIFEQTIWLNAILYTLANILYGYLCFNITLKKSVFYGFVLTVLGIIFESVPELILISQFGIPESKLYFWDFQMTIVAVTKSILLFILVLLMAKFVVKDDSVKPPVSFFIYPLVTMISMIAFWYVCMYCGMNSAGQIALAFISLVLVVPTTLLFLFYQRNIEKENEFFLLNNEKEKFETEKTYFDILDKQNQELRIYAHDTKNHLTAIKSLNTDPKIDEYITRMSKNLANYSNVSHSGNHTLDVIINKYVTECEIKGVSFNFDTRLKNLEYVEDYDLVAILGNLLDNALESAEKAEKREISLSTDYRNTYDVLIITNSCDTTPVTINNKLVTTKSDKKIHGIGLESVAKTLRKYSGDLDWEYDAHKNLFTTTVMMSEVK